MWDRRASLLAMDPLFPFWKTSPLMFLLRYMPLCPRSPIAGTRVYPEVKIFFTYLSFAFGLPCHYKMYPSFLAWLHQHWWWKIGVSGFQSKLQHLGCFRKLRPQDNPGVHYFPTFSSTNIFPALLGITILDHARSCEISCDPKWQHFGLGCYKRKA